MKRIPIVCLSAIAALAYLPISTAAAEPDAISDKQMVVVEAEPGRAVAKPMAPSWCGVADEKAGFGSGRLGRYIRNVVENSWSPAVLGEGGAGLCGHPDDPSWQMQTGYFMQIWMNWTGLSQRQVEASITQRVQVKRWDKLRAQACAAFRTDDETSELDAFEMKAKAEVLGCGDQIGVWAPRPRVRDEYVWFLDRYQEPGSELVRVHRVMSCLSDPFGAHWSASPENLAAYALCGVDARRLDPAKLERELSQGKYNDFAKTTARESHGRAMIEAAAYEKAVNALAKKDPDYKRVFIDAPESAWKAWTEVAAKHEAALKASVDFDVKAFGPSQKATDGCVPGLRSGFRAFMTSGGVKTEEDAAARAASPVGAALLSRLMHCEARENNFNTGGLLTELYEKGRQAQGARYAVYYAVVAAVAEISADRTKFPLSIGSFGQLPWGPYVDGTYAEVELAKKRVGNTLPGKKAGTLMEDVKGTIKAVKKNGSDVEVTFKTEKWKEAMQECKDSKKIWRIDSDGTIHYYPTCKSIGHKVISHTEKPIVIPADAAEGLRPGMLLIGRGEFPFDNGKKRLGYPTAVYDSTKKKTLISWYGIKL